MPAGPEAGPAARAAGLFQLLEHPGFREGVHWRRLRLGPDATVFSEGDEGREVYLVLAGAVRVLGNVDLDQERRLHPGFSDLGPGEVFGELALFDHQPRSATVTTVAPTELAVLEGERLLAFLDDHPEVGYPIFRELIFLLAQRLRQANRRVFSIFAWALKARGIDREL
ncbi:MAG: hypothetical protein D6809_05565 [Gammaproteobacteria bacterium]|nr:MAG: hypothetical protein D6809_05565 [Gammaproteobacteria bacterium]